jgi:hypothetical protein
MPPPAGLVIEASEEVRRALGKGQITRLPDIRERGRDEGCLVVLTGRVPYGRGTRAG